MTLPVGSNYVRQVNTPTKIGLQIVIPKNFLSTDRLLKNKSRFMQDIQRETTDFWITAASQKLNKTRDRYVDNLFVRKTGDKNIVFELVGPAVPVERGWEPFDMKPGFAASPKLMNNKMKIPADKRAEFVKGKAPTPKLIIPIDPQRGIFRTFTLAQMGTNLWVNEGYKGINLIPIVKQQLKEVIIPKYVGRYARDAFTK